MRALEGHILLDAAVRGEETDDSIAKQRLMATVMKAKSKRRSCRGEEGGEK